MHFTVVPLVASKISLPPPSSAFYRATVQAQKARTIFSTTPFCRRFPSVVGHSLCVLFSLTQTSLAERVEAKGGKFLEAPVSGSKGQAAGVSPS